MTVVLEFRSPPTTVRRFGPLGGFMVDRESLREHPGGSVLAIHQRQAWQVDGAPYPRMDCIGKVRLRFERKGKAEMSRMFGPHEALSIFDGVVYLGSRVFASMDERSNDWFSHEDGRHWPLMLAESPTT